MRPSGLAQQSQEVYSSMTAVLFFKARGWWGPEHGGKQALRPVA